MEAAPTVAPTAAPRHVRQNVDVGKGTHGYRGDRRRLRGSRHGGENQARNCECKYCTQHVCLPVLPASCRPRSRYLQAIMRWTKNRIELDRSPIVGLPQDLGPSAPPPAPCFDADAATDLYAHIRARNLHEARAILCARIATDSWVQCFRLWRVLTRLIGLLSNRDPGRQNCNNNRKDDFSHELFYRVVRTFPTAWTANSVFAMHPRGWRCADSTGAHLCSSRQGKAPGPSCPWPHIAN
jgi:hypothetical protein